MFKKINSNNFIKINNGASIKYEVKGNQGRGDDYILFIKKKEKINKYRVITDSYSFTPEFSNINFLILLETALKKFFFV